MHSSPRPDRTIACLPRLLPSVWGLQGGRFYFLWHLLDSSDSTAHDIMAIPPNPVGRAVFIIAAVFTAVDLGFIVLRLWARRLKRVSLDVSDYLIITAWVCDYSDLHKCVHLANSGLKLIAVADMIRKIIAANWGVGTHFNDLMAVSGPSVIIPINKVCHCIQSSISKY